MKRPFEVPERIHTAGMDFLVGWGTSPLDWRTLGIEWVSVMDRVVAVVMMLRKGKMARINFVL